VGSSRPISGLRTANQSHPPWIATLRQRKQPSAAQGRIPYDKEGETLGLRAPE
jgi:hypothetical protein